MLGAQLAPGAKGPDISYGEWGGTKGEDKMYEPLLSGEIKLCQGYLPEKII